MKKRYEIISECYVDGQYKPIEEYLSFILQDNFPCYNLLKIKDKIIDKKTNKCVKWRIVASTKKKKNGDTGFYVSHEKQMLLENTLFNLNEKNDDDQLYLKQIKEFSK